MCLKDGAVGPAKLDGMVGGPRATGVEILGLLVRADGYDEPVQKVACAEQPKGFDQITESVEQVVNRTDVNTYYYIHCTLKLREFHQECPREHRVAIKDCLWLNG
jgi:hypothetical protein